MKGSPYSALRRVNIITLSAGHGAADPGAVAGKFTERERVITLTDLTAGLLRSVLGTGAVVVTPHSEDTHDSVKWINARYKFGTAWSLELHSDSSDRVKGDDADLRCGVYHGSHGDSPAIARGMAEAMKRYGAHPNTWARNHSAHRAGSLMWIRQTAPLSHLLELGFMEGRNDPAHLARLARICAGGIAYAFAGKYFQFPAE